MAGVPLAAMMSMTISDSKNTIASLEVGAMSTFTKTLIDALRLAGSLPVL